MKMKEIWAVIGTIMAYLEYAHAGTQTGINLYSERYNTLDIDTILNSDRLVTNYVECLLSRKPCSPEGKELKRLLPEALRTKCSKCSNQQKEGALKVLKKLYTYYPIYYNDLRAKWDQSGEYHRKFEQYLREEQFNSISVDYEKDQTHQVDIYQGSPNKVPQVVQQYQPAIVPQATTQQPQLETQRPARNPDGEQQNFGLNPSQPTATVAVPTPQTSPPTTVDIFNRFGGGNDDNDEDTASALSPSAAPSSNINTPALALPNARPTYLPPQSSIAQSSSQINAQTNLFTQPQKNQLGQIVKPTVLRPIGNSMSETVNLPSPSSSSSSSLASSPTMSISQNDKTDDGIINNNSNNNVLSTASTSVVPPFQPFQPNGNGPFGLGIFQRIGHKITNTAEFLAEMVRSTVKRP